MGSDKERMSQIERELSDAVSTSQAQWARIYRLLEEIRAGRLWEGNAASFTAWVRAAAARMGVAESLLWKRHKAGRVYEEYAQRVAEKGGITPTIEALQNVSPDSLELCASVAHGNKEQLDQLISKVVEGKLNRADLREAARANKAARLAANAAKERALEGADSTGAGVLVIGDDVPAPKPTLTASDIVTALRQQSSWLEEPDDDSKTNFSTPPVYHVLTEVRAESGTAHHARRIDAVVAETESLPPWQRADNVVLHGVEIKVAEHDLRGDQKMSEYEAFCDYFWFAVPDTEDMTSAAAEVSRPAWGILAVSQAGRVRVVRRSERLPGTLRDKTMATIIVRARDFRV